MVGTVVTVWCAVCSVGDAAGLYMNSKYHFCNQWDNYNRYAMSQFVGIGILVIFMFYSIYLML
jgi:hypothetical protein